MISRGNYTNTWGFYSFLWHIFVKSTKKEREAWLMIYPRSHTSIWERVEVKVRGSAFASPECRITSQIFAHTHTVIITSFLYKMLTIIFYQNRSMSVRNTKYCSEYLNSVRNTKEHYCNQWDFGFIKAWAKLVNQFSISKHSASSFSHILIDS